VVNKVFKTSLASPEEEGEAEEATVSVPKKQSWRKEIAPKQSKRTRILNMVGKIIGRSSK
jgi:hypothetical protein